MFKDQVVVITGGNSGIGRAIAKKFDEKGAKIAIFGRDKKRLEETRSELRQAICVQGDVKNLTDLDDLFEQTSIHLGKIDVLIVNAGVAMKRPISEVDEAFFDEMVDTNYKGAYFTVQRSLSLLNPGSSILFISSMAGHTGWPSHSVYSSTKAAVSILAKSLSADLIHQGIRVNALSPGYTETPIFDPIKEIDPHYLIKRCKNVPLGRFAQSEEIANAACFLSSPEASYIVGVDLVVDGGVTAIFPDQKEETKLGHQISSSNR